MKLILTLLLSVGIFTGITGCSHPTPTPGPEEISNSLVISYRIGPEIHSEGYVEAVIDNVSTYCIVFPNDYGIKLFMEKTNGVEEIKDTTIYIGNRPNYLKPIGNIESGFILVFSPDVSNQQITQQTNFFAEITGHLCDDESIVIKKRIPFVVNP